MCRTEVLVDRNTYALLMQDCMYRGAYEWGKRIHARADGLLYC